MNVKILLLPILGYLLFYPQVQKPSLYLIGDSTVEAASASNPIQGWGGKLFDYFDNDRIRLQNRAVSGISSRTYQTGVVHQPSMLKNGMWKGVMAELKAGDFVIMQFGHNDESPVIDTLRMRGTIKGTGNDSLITVNHFTKQQETVKTYGYYISKLVADIKSRNAVPIICSPIPKNRWLEDRVIRNDQDYGKWAKEVAETTGAYFVDLNKLIADEYDNQGKERVAAYFVEDKIHTTQIGAALNASLLISALKKMKKNNLKEYLNQNH
ncbi:MAG: hypothetical protein EOO90_12870 [Pedobacter sp.]|nr:MAG: hypothetical protein EOO90_12870 [Pedobacter sp.]